jgi:hypothetical protein
MTLSVRIIIILFELIAYSHALGAWPKIRPHHVRQTYRIRGDSDTPFLMSVESLAGTPLYRFECHNGNYEDTSFINFSGDFQCALFSLDHGQRSSWNLLPSDERSEQTSDYFSRGRMTSNQLWGACGVTPEYGLVRHFSLRGMPVTIEFKDLGGGPSKGHEQARLNEFTFSLDISPEKTATSPTAASVGVNRPAYPCR